MGIDTWVVCADCWKNQILDRWKYLEAGNIPENSARLLVAFIREHGGHRIHLLTDHELTDFEANPPDPAVEARSTRQAVSDSLRENREAYERLGKR